MHSQPTPFTVPAERSAAAAFEYLLSQMHTHLDAVQHALSDAHSDPLSAYQHLPDLTQALKELERHQQQLGETLMRALLQGQQHEIAHTCANWSGAVQSSDNTSAKVAGLDEENDPSVHPEDSPGRTPKFVTVQATATPAPARSECVLSKIAKPPKTFVPVAQIVPPPKAPPADLSVLDTSALFANGRGFQDSAQQRHTISEAQRRRAMELVRDASTPPETFLRLKQADAFMGSLKKLIEDKNLAFYAELPNAWHHAMTDYITAYARHLQDAVCGQFSDTCAFESEFEAIFRTLTSFSKNTEPGFIYGLKKNSSPNDGDNWHASLQSRKRTLQKLADETLTEASEDNVEDQRRSAITDVLRRMHEAVENQTHNGSTHQEIILELTREALSYRINPQHPRLLSALQNYFDIIDEHPDLKTIARALRDDAKEREIAASKDQSIDDEFRASWPYKERTQGKKLALIGGNRRKDAEQNIRDAFGFEDVLWISTDAGKHARQRKFEARFKNGTYDFVVAIQNLVGHAWTELIFNQTPPNTVAALTSGYGVQAIGRALARYSGWERASAHPSE